MKKLLLSSAFLLTIFCGLSQADDHAPYWRNHHHYVWVEGHNVFHHGEKFWVKGHYAIEVIK